MCYRKLNKYIATCMAVVCMISPLTYSNVYGDESSSREGVRILSRTPEIDGEVDKLTEEQFHQGFVASQYVRPFGGTLQGVLNNSNMNELLPELFDGDDPISIQYSELMVKSGSSYRRANVSDLFEYSGSSTPTEFFVNYEYDVEVVFEYDAKEENPETGEMVDVVRRGTRTETVNDYQKVFYTNAYSYFYLGLFASDDTAIAENVKNLTTGTAKPLLIDMYGNIVIDDTGSARQHLYVAVPAVANPMLFEDDEFYMPTRKLISLAQPELFDVIDKDDLSVDEMENFVGDKLSGSEVGIYDASSDFLEGSLGVFSWLNYFQKKSYMSSIDLIENLIDPRTDSYDPLGTYLSEDYANFLGANDKGDDDVEDLFLFSFGPNHVNTFANRFQTDSYQGDMKAIIVTGLGRTNSSTAALPKDRLYWGSAFERNKVDVDDKKLVFYTPNNVDSMKGSIICDNANWSGDYSPNDTGTMLETSKSYMSGLDYDLMELMIDFTVESKDVEGDPAEDLIETPEDLYDKKVNGVVDHMSHLFNNMGSATTAMRTSGLSKDYVNTSSSFKKNYLFHIDEVLEDPYLMTLVIHYLNFVILLNVLIAFAMLIGSSVKGNLDWLSFVKKFFICIIMTYIPVLILVYFTSGYNIIAQKLFDNALVYWSAIDLNVVHSATDAENEFQQGVNNYFREYNLVDDSGSTSINMYTGKYDGSTTTNTLCILADNIAYPDAKSAGEVFHNSYRYNESLFYYFYDNYKWHLYNYYADEINADSFKGWDNPRGLVETTGKVIAMFEDPVFLYGSSYLNMTGDVEDFDSWSDVYIQDIAGLGPLFSDPTDGTIRGYLKDIRNSTSYNTILKHSFLSNKTNKDTLYNEYFDNSKYPSGVVRASHNYNSIYGNMELNPLESKLIRVNERVDLALRRLQGYQEYKDETVLFIAALLTTFEFNEEFNRGISLSHRLEPYTLNTETLSLDLIYRGIYLEDVKSNTMHRGDIISAVESRGGLPAQVLIIVTSFVANLCGFVSYMFTFVIFCFSIYVFVLAYTFKRDLFNKAWVGLAFFAGSILLIHACFTICVNLLSVPPDKDSIFLWLYDFTGSVKHVVLFALICLRAFLIGRLTVFAIKNPTDLGGAIISEKAQVMFDNVRGRINNFGDSTSESASSDIDIENSNIDQGDVSSGSGRDITIEGTAQLTSCEGATGILEEPVGYNNSASEMSDALNSMSSEQSLSVVESYSNTDSQTYVSSSSDVIDNSSNTTVSEISTISTQSTDSISTTSQNSSASEVATSQQSATSASGNLISGTTTSEVTSNATTSASSSVDGSTGSSMSTQTSTGREVEQKVSGVSVEAPSMASTDTVNVNNKNDVVVKSVETVERQSTVETSSTVNTKVVNKRSSVFQKEQEFISGTAGTKGALDELLSLMGDDD